MILGKQEYSARTLGATWGIISAIMLPIVIVLICIGWRLLKRWKKNADTSEDEYAYKKPYIDEPLHVNSDDESIPYKKDTTEDSPLPSEPLRVFDEPGDIGIPVYDQQQHYPPPPPPHQSYGLPQHQPYTSAQDPSAQDPSYPLVQDPSYPPAQDQTYPPAQDQTYPSGQDSLYPSAASTVQARDAKWTGETEIN